MPNVAKGDIKEKLSYLGLDLKKTPDFLKELDPINFNPSRLNTDRVHRVYRYVPIDNIEILLSPTYRNDDVRKKYSLSSPLISYIEPRDEQEEAEKYTTLLDLISKMSIPEVEEIEQKQNQLTNMVPFRVKYPKNHLWQIYFSEATNKYFMIVSTKESTFAEFFYLLKKQIQFYKNTPRIVPKIFVPVNCMNYTEEFLSKGEIADLENYLWIFTKNWPLIFEVFDKQEEMTIQIVGDTYVYSPVKSSYKIKLNNREEAIKFYKLLKALFLLNTEIKNGYQFETKIDSKNSLEFYYDNKRIEYENLTDFVKTEYLKTEEKIKDKTSKIGAKKAKLERLKNESNIKDREYEMKKKEISTFLEYRKTFLGKVKYFFKSNKKNNPIIKEDIHDEIARRNSVKQLFEKNEDGQKQETERLYTIEDLITIYSNYDKLDKEIKDLNQDIKALELKIINMIKKIENATIYIEEIDKHKRSIFEFFRFANKDEKLALEMGNEENDKSEKNNIQKVFNYEMDFENLGIEVDKLQRKKLSKEELDATYIATTEALKSINMLYNHNLDKDSISSLLENLREELSENKFVVEAETFDIFGNIDSDNTKLKYIKNQSHRENEKNKFAILNVNKKIDIFDFTEKLQSILNYLKEASNKIKSNFDMPLYKLVHINENIETNGFQTYNINIEDELEEFDSVGERAMNLVKINFKEKMPLLYFSNIILYDNLNKTLPEGMGLSSKVLIDSNKFKFDLKNKTKFRTNNYFKQENKILPETKDIFVYEYDVVYNENNK